MAQNRESAWGVGREDKLAYASVSSSAKGRPLIPPYDGYMDEMRSVNNLAQSWCFEGQLQIMLLVAASPPSSGSSNSVITPLLGEG